MRTTLDIDTDVLNALKTLSQQRGIALGRLATDLLRQALTAKRVNHWEMKNGVPLFPQRAIGKIVTLKLVNELRDEFPS